MYIQKKLWKTTTVEVCEYTFLWLALLYGYGYLNNIRILYIVIYSIINRR